MDEKRSMRLRAGTEDREQMQGTKMVGCRGIVYIWIAALHLVGIAVFCWGYFPRKTVLHGVSEFEGGILPFVEDGKGKFDKMVLMVVDALRVDFMFSEESEMTFVQKLVRGNSGIPFTANAHPPTVTLPRLKGITTGGTPSFIDAVLNIADDKDNSQSLENEDSWVRQLKLRNKKLSFFGDDTWLKLFPAASFFDKYDGTGSFFVSDFTEVDQNVTRHLNDGFFQSEWDVLILHYLGLDHIGHKGGPKSKFMGPKQREMDEIVADLYEKAVDDRTLLVVMGDHGMNEIGNHGGASIGETSPGLLMASKQFQRLDLNLQCPLKVSDEMNYYNRINQIDIVPALAALLNLPIPKNSLGVIPMEILSTWSEPNRRKVLAENGNQLFALYSAKYSKTDSKFAAWKEVQSTGTIEEIYDFLFWLQENLATSATDYSYTKIYTGLSILALAATLSIVAYSKEFLTYSKNIGFSLFFVAFTLVYALQFHASSLIEEEHQLWWFLTISIFLSVFVSSKSNNLLAFSGVLLCLRIIRAWSNSGQKFKTDGTIGSYLLKNSNVLWFSIFLTYSFMAVNLYVKGGMLNCFCKELYASFKDYTKDFGGAVTFIAIFTTYSISFLFKLCQYYSDGNKVPKSAFRFITWICQSFDPDFDVHNPYSFSQLNVTLSKHFFMLIAAMIILRISFGWYRGVKLTISDVSDMITLLLMHQSRAEIIPMFLVLQILRFFISALKFSKHSDSFHSEILKVSMITICLQNLSFFSMGNTNLLATIDLSNSYNGFNSYDVFLVGLATFVSTFAGPIYWSLSSLQFIEIVKQRRLLCNSRKRMIQVDSPYLAKVRLSLFFYSISGMSLMASCFNLRFHLFVWSVFAPKVLYYIAWAVLQNTLVDTMLIPVIISFENTT